MKTKEIVVGIDTSNYTTSISAVSLEGDVLANIKNILPVKLGECGLRQSDALFAHIKNLPIAMQELRSMVGDATPIAIGVSTTPRRQEGSYMPVFLAGVASAASISSAFKIPRYEFSHQCGHIMAALHSSRRFDLVEKTFVAFHVSGGTTEMVRVSPAEIGFSAEIIGGTLDISAGQLIDRIGVALGLPFPAGAHLEKLALEYTGKKIKAKIAAKGLYVNLSGIENRAIKLLSDTGDKAMVASFVLEHIASALLHMAKEYIAVYGDVDFIFAGGVMSNSIVKERISHEIDASFAEPALSSDNAVGVALLALKEYLK